MNLKLFALATSAILFSFHVNAQSPSISPAPSWVTPVAPSLTAKPLDGAAAGGFYYLLLDQQENISLKEFYRHFAYVLLTNDGVQSLSDISITYDPSYQHLILHQITVHRGNQKLSQLSLSDVKTIQREESMDRYLYDGSVTAIVNLKDIRVGDVIEYAYTLKGSNPIFNDHYSQKLYFDYSIPIERVVNRIVTPTKKELHFTFRNGDVKPRTTTTKDGIEYEWTFNKVKASIADENRPSWYDPFRHVMITDFTHWSEVTDWAVHHFELSEKEKTQLQSRIQGTLKSSNKEDLILEAVRFVQNDIRYLGFESGLNSHKPHSPIKVYDQRYGDCKDKSLLLSSILQLNGVEAYPMLVNSITQKHVEDSVPTIHAFNHCVTQILYDGRVFYVDPTISNQGGPLANNYFPPYGKGLVIRKNNQGLISLPAPGVSEISEEETFEINSIGGEAFLNIKTTYKGGEADNMRGQLASRSRDEIQKSYLNYYGNLYPALQEEGSLTTTDDILSNMLVMEERYRIPGFWKPVDGSENKIFCELYPLAIENLVNVSKSTNRTSPYFLNHPVSYQHTTLALLPQEWPIEETNLDIKGTAYEYRHEIFYSDRRLTLYHHYQTLSDHVVLEDVPKFIADHQAIMRNLNYSLTYDKSFEAMTGINGYSVCFGLIVFIGALYLVYRLYQYDPKPALDSTDGEPIGGWLILVAIGIVLSPFRLVWDFLVTHEFFSNQTWLGLLSQKKWAILSLVTFELIYNVISILYSVLLVILFLKRRSSLPRLISIFYITSFAMIVIDSIAVQLLIESNEPYSYKALIQTFVAAIIWVPYFNMSQRVNETFVERLDDDSSGGQPLEPSDGEGKSEVNL